MFLWYFTIKPGKGNVCEHGRDLQNKTMGKPNSEEYRVAHLRWGTM